MEYMNMETIELMFKNMILKREKTVYKNNTISSDLHIVIQGRVSVFNSRMTIVNEVTNGNIID